MEALFSQQGIYFLLKWAHFLTGITWIGLLYYFNFVQGGFFAEIDATVKNVAIQRLVPRALWWFRWGAVFTWLTGFIMFMMWAGQVGHGEFFATPAGAKISIGALMGTIMFLNVWGIIWRNQKIVIASANQILTGGSALPNAAAAGAKALLASRTNTLLSISMLFFMGAARNLPNTFDGGSLAAFWIAIFVVLGLIEFNAIKGKLGPLTSVKGVISCGFALTAVLYLIMEVLA